MSWSNSNQRKSWRRDWRRRAGLWSHAAAATEAQNLLERRHYFPKIRTCHTVKNIHIHIIKKIPSDFGTKLHRKFFPAFIRLSAGVGPGGAYFFELSANQALSQELIFIGRVLHQKPNLAFNSLSPNWTYKWALANCEKNLSIFEHLDKCLVKYLKKVNGPTAVVLICFDIGSLSLRRDPFYLLPGALLVNPERL